MADVEAVKRLIAECFADLPGTVNTTYGTLPRFRNATIVLVEHVVGGRVIAAAHVVLGNALIGDFPTAEVAREIASNVDRYLRPWKFADRYSWPTFVLFPWLRPIEERLDRLASRARLEWMMAKLRAKRLREAW